MSAYSARILSDGAVAHWRLGEASGLVAADAGPNGLSGVIAATGVTYGAGGALVNDADTALTFAGSSDPITVLDNNALDLGDGPLSIEFWVKRSATQGAVQNLLWKGTDAYRVVFKLNNRIGFQKNNTDIATSQVITNQNWHHVVVTKSGSASKIYVDGVDVTVAGTAQTLADTTAPLAIGYTSAGTPQRFPGSMDEVALYNLVLTPTQVLEHFELGRTQPLTDSVTASESVSLEPGVVQADTVTASETRILDVSTAPSDTATVSDAETKDVSQALADSLTASESVSSEPDVALSDTATVSDAVSLEPDIGPSDTATATDVQVADVEKALDDSLTPSDALVTEGAATLGDSVTVTDFAVVELFTELSLSDSVTVTDAETPVLTPGTVVLPIPEGGWRPVKLPQALRVAIRDEVFATDDFEFEYEEGIPTRRQKRELALLA